MNKNTRFMLVQSVKHIFPQEPVVFQKCAYFKFSLSCIDIFVLGFSRNVWEGVLIRWSVSMLTEPWSIFNIQNKKASTLKSLQRQKSGKKQAYRYSKLLLILTCRNRMMTTGKHSISFISCIYCGDGLGWKYASILKFISSFYELLIKIYRLKLTKKIKSTRKVDLYLSNVTFMSFVIYQIHTCPNPYTISSSFDNNNKK